MSDVMANLSLNETDTDECTFEASGIISATGDDGITYLSQI